MAVKNENELKIERAIVRKRSESVLANELGRRQLKIDQGRAKMVFIIGHL
ncbi:hypothetical protein [Levilactobacillus sp. HBUAS70063]